MQHFMTLFGLSLSRWNTILKSRICHRMLNLHSPPDVTAPRRSLGTSLLLEVLPALQVLGALVGVAIFLFIKVGGRCRQSTQD